MRVSALLAAFLAAGCGGGSGTAPAAPASTPTPAATDVRVSGRITDYISGAPCGGSRVRFAGPGGAVQEAITLADGSYVLERVTTGNHTVTVTGEDHVTHTTDAVSVTTSNASRINMGVIRRDKEHPRVPGVRFTDSYEAFFNQFARDGLPGEPYYNGYENRLLKWNYDKPPTKIYLVEGKLSNDAMNEAINIFTTASNLNTSDMFCEDRTPLPVEHGPVLSTIPDGTLYVDFEEASNSGLPVRGSDGYARYGKINIRRSYIERKDVTTETKTRVAIHEMLHAYGAKHVNAISNSIMTSPAPSESVLSEDKLAMCLVRALPLDNRSPDNDALLVVAANDNGKIVPMEYSADVLSPDFFREPATQPRREERVRGN